MNSIIFLTAFYDINKSYSNEIIERLKIITKYIPLNIFCSEKSVPILETIPNLFLQVKEFETFETYKILYDAEKLPEKRSIEKDTKEFMILMNMKTECLALVKQKISKDINYFIWLDAGISKIFSDPDKTFSYFISRIQEVSLPKDKILIPGCWNRQSNIQILSYCINWRFCGGFFCVPEHLIFDFANKVLEACKEIKIKTKKAIWEVNVWAYIESKLPIEWRRGDHNESIFSF